VFAFVPDFENRLAVFLFSGVVADVDHEVCEKALQTFNTRLGTTPLPVMLLVDESRSEGHGLAFPRFRDAAPPARTLTLLAIVTPSARGVLRALGWAVATRYLVYAAETVDEAVAWVEKRREAQLAAVFQHLLAEARSVTGPDTGR
jgi:hypothetical protein